MIYISMFDSNLIQNDFICQTKESINITPLTPLFVTPTQVQLFNVSIYIISLYIILLCIIFVKHYVNTKYKRH
jgi:hypothetical protein